MRTVFKGPSEAVCSVHLSSSQSQRPVFIVPAGLSSLEAEGIYFQAIVLPFDEGDNLFPCRREAHGGSRDRVQSNPQLGCVKRAGRRARVLGLAVDGGTVCFGFPRRADYPHEAVSELLKDQPLRFGLRLMSLFRPFGLFQQTLARRFKHLLCHKCIRQPAGR